MLPYLLCIDYETSGIDVRENKAQPISVGAIILDTKSLVTLDSCYIECQFDLNRFEWDNRAEKVHGLSIDYLSDKQSMKDAATELFGFIVKYFKAGDAVTIIGHNPHFDARCLDLWMDEIGITLRQSHRKLDTFSVGFAVFGAETSDELFAHVGLVRNSHNALEDAEATVAAVRLARKVGSIYKALLSEKQEG